MLTGDSAPSAITHERPVISLQEAAEILGISESTARRLAQAGTLPGILPKLGSQWRVNRHKLNQYVHGEQPTPMDA